MKAIRYSEYGTPDVLEYLELDDGARARRGSDRGPRQSSRDWSPRRKSAGHLSNQADDPRQRRRGHRRRRGRRGLDQNGEQICFVTEHVEPGSYAELVARPREMTIPKPPNIFAEAAQ